MINGVVAVPIMVVMMLMCQNKKLMGQFTRVSKDIALGLACHRRHGRGRRGLFLTWKR